MQRTPQIKEQTLAQCHVCFKQRDSRIEEDTEEGRERNGQTANQGVKERGDREKEVHSRRVEESGGKRNTSLVKLLNIFLSCHSFSESQIMSEVAPETSCLKQFYRIRLRSIVSMNRAKQNSLQACVALTACCFF